MDKILDQANGILLNQELSQLCTTAHPEAMPKAPHP